MLLSLDLHLASRRGQALAKDFLLSIINGEIRGRLVVGRVGELSHARALVFDVSLFDEQQRRVVHAERVELEFKPLDLLRGTLRFPRAELAGGDVWLHPGQEGTPTLLESLAPRVQSDSEEPGIHVVVEDVYLRETRVRGTLLGLEGLDLKNVQLHGRLEAKGPLLITIWSGGADVVEPFALTGKIRKLRGHVSSDSRQGIRLAARATAGEDLAWVKMQFTGPPETVPQSPDQLELAIKARRIHASTLRALGFEWAEPLTGVFRGDVQLSGPVERLRLAANLETEGGPLVLSGAFDPASTTVAATTPGLHVARVVRGAPDVTLAGRAELSLPQDPSASPVITVDLAPFRFGAYHVPAVVGVAEVAEDHVRVQELRTTSIAGEATAAGVVGFDGRLHMDVRARLVALQREPNVRRLAPLARGALQGSFHIDRAAGASSIELRGSVGLRDFSYGPLTAHSMVVTGVVRGDPAQPEVQLSVDGEEVAVGGYPLGAAEVRLRGGPARYQATARFRAQGERNVDIDAHMVAGQRATEVQATRIELSVGDLAWRGGVQRLLRHHDGSLELSGLSLASGSQRLEVDGSWRPRGPEALDARLQDFDLAALRAIFGKHMPDIHGRADAHLQIEGDYREPQIAIQGALRDGVVGGVEGVQAVYLVAYEPGKVEVDGQIDLGKRGSFSLGGSGIVETSGSDLLSSLRRGLYDLEGEVAGLDLGLLVEAGVLPSGIGGRVSGALNASGPLEAPSFRGYFAVPCLQVAGFETLGVEAQFHYENAVLNALVQTRDREAPFIEAEGSLLIDLVYLLENPEEGLAALETSPWRLAMRLEPRKLGAWPMPLPSFVPTDFDGVRVGGTASLQGGAFETRGEVALAVEWTESLEGLACGQDAFPRMLIHGRLANGETTIDARAFIGARMAAFAKAHMDTPVGAWLRDASHFALPELDLAVDLSALALEDVPIVCEWASGEVDGRLRVSGLLAGVPRGHIQLSSDSLGLYQMPPASARLEGKLDADAMSLDAAFGWGGNQSFRFLARLPIRWAGDFPPRVREDAPLSVDARFTDAPVASLLTPVPNVVRADGSLSGKLSIRGTLEDPRLEGRAQLRHGFLELIGLGQQLTGVSGALDLAGGRALLRDLHASDADGAVHIDGSFSLDGFRPDRGTLHIRSEDFPIRREGAVLATLTGRASADAEIGPARTEAHVEVAELAISLPDKSPRSLQPLEAHPDVVFRGVERTAEPSEEPYVFRFVIKETPPFWVRRSDFGARVRARLEATYRDPELRIAGFIDLQRGFFEVFGKRFEVERGTLDFQGDAEINPEVNLVATHLLGGTSATAITVTVTGRLNSPVVEFSSTIPGQTRSEIIGQLVSGRRSPAGSSATSPDQEQEAGQAAASFLAGLTAGVLTLTARQELGDVLPVIVIESGDQAFQSARVRAGFQADSVIPKFLRGIVQGAYVEGFFTASTADGRQQTATTQGGGSGFLLELQFPHNIVGSGTYSPPDSWSLDVIWEP